MRRKENVNLAFRGKKEREMRTNAPGSGAPGCGFGGEGAGRAFRQTRQETHRVKGWFGNRGNVKKAQEACCSGGAKSRGKVSAG
jgi:hypothetical protein